MAYIDPVNVSPNNYKVLLENGHVRVLEMNLRASEKDEVHSHPAETVYFLTGGKAKIHLPDGQVVEADLPDGHVMWNDAWTHQVENAGTSDIRAIIVEDQRGRK
ncbi:MAG: hypothetical protein U1B78_03605 [Dehalococcoidia bacterium]|nr:hypothetical protein [Dehalococcoidia bacterium]